MDAILFSAESAIANDAINHLMNHDNLYFSVRFRINKKQFSFPLQGFIHVNKDKVKYLATIEDIVPYAKEHFEKDNFKPKKWRDEWKNNRDNSYKYTLIIKNVDEFNYDTLRIKKHDGEFVKQEPQSYIKIIPPSQPSKIGKRKPIEQERKLRIEKAAIDSVIDYYIKQGYDTESVEKDNIGYDLVAIQDEKELYVEVKGTSISNINNATVGLTPNEYEASKNNRDKFRICIVSGALSNPMVHEFVWDKSKTAWYNEKALLRLNFQEIISANISIENNDSM